MRGALRLTGLYPGGLSRPQREYLEFLAESETHTAGVDSLAVFLALDNKDIVAGTEQYLISRDSRW